MAIFTAVATTLLAGTFLAGTFAVPLLAGGLALGTSYAVSALTGKSQPEAQEKDHFKLQGKLQAAGDLPRSFLMGYSATAGSLKYFNEWGVDGETPNAYHTRVIQLSDLPVPALREVWVAGELCTLGDHGEYGYAVTQYNRDGRDHLWIEYYDGTQTAASDFLMARVSSAERPWGPSRVGYGCSYVTVTMLVHDTLWSGGAPEFKFALGGIPLYDPSRDSTVGGNGTHRWSDPASWGGDGDHLPAVQLYNVLRGIRYNSQWIYGLQKMTAARLPVANWIAQIQKCRADIASATGVRATYKSGLQVNCNVQTVNTVRTLLTAMHGRLSQIGGVYKLDCGAPGPAIFTFTDADLRTDEAQIFNPFPSLSSSVNGIVARYPCPAEAWNPGKVSPVYTRADMQARDGGRQLYASPSYDAVTDAEQVQHLNKSALDEAARGRTFVLPFTAAFWFVEPNDICAWSSERNGFSNKLFRVEGGTDKGNLDVTLRLIEIDPSDHGWNPGTDYRPQPNSPTISPRPSPQAIVDFDVEAVTIKDQLGAARRPAIRLKWYNEMPGVNGVAFQIRLKASQEVVHSGNTMALDIGAIDIGHNILPAQLYQVQAQYIPTWPRDMLPSAWMDVLTHDVRFSLEEFNADIAQKLREIEGINVPEVQRGVAIIERIVADLASQNWLDKKTSRTELNAVAGGANAKIEELRTAAVNDRQAIAQLSTSVEARFGEVYSTVNIVAESVANVEGWAASRYSVKLDVNNYMVGIELFNGGPGADSITLLTTKFQIAAPGIAPRPILTVGFINGQAKVGFRADEVVFDGTIFASQIAAGQVKTVHLEAQTVTADKIRSGAITSDSGVIGALAVKSLSIGDNAVTVPKVHTAVNQISDPFNNWVTTGNILTLDIDTTGLAGKEITIYASETCAIGNIGSGDQTVSGYLYINGAQVMGATYASGTGVSGTCSLAGSYSFIADGGMNSIQVRFDITGGKGAAAYNRVLFALAVKR